MNEGLFDSVYSVIESDFDARVKRRQPEIVSVVMRWLTTEARVKPVPDLAVRLEGMQRRVERMAKEMKVRMVEGKLVVKVSGSDEETLKMFRLGTTWFEAHPDIKILLLAGLFDETS